MLLDTNALMVPEQIGVDIFAELERLGYRQFLVPSPVLKELKALSSFANSGKDRLAAKIGLDLANRCEFLDASGEADQILMELALKQDAAVFTNDKDLKKKLSSSGITVIHLRQRRYLEIVSGRSFDV
ncbi:MAG: type II toxin-antitoxin system VapC family toxin [Methanotrichaceae archaeon]